ncbi:MAG: hypothetical protein IIY93_02375 [Clostridia bacterium]|nr:hypothetical protein [Clostridia bacterium]MBQ1554201.1 hypothetical protein [Clostridia bacterium]
MNKNMLSFCHGKIITRMKYSCRRLMHMKRKYSALFLAMALVITAAGSPISAGWQSCAAAGYSSTAEADSAQRVAALVNQARAANGLSPLRYSERLSEAALVRARELPSLFSHTRPDGTSCFTAISQAGISYRTAGENIAYGQRSADEVMEAWMNSAGHRANILGKDFAYIGVGVFYQNGTYYWTQFFAASDDLSGEIVTTASTTADASTTAPSMTTTVPVSTVSTATPGSDGQEETETASASHPSRITGETLCSEDADGCGHDRKDRIQLLVNLLREKLLRKNDSCN